MALDSYALIPNALVVEGGQGSCVFMLQEDSFAPLVFQLVLGN